MVAEVRDLGLLAVGLLQLMLQLRKHDKSKANRCCEELASSYLGPIVFWMTTPPVASAASYKSTVFSQAALFFRTMGEELFFFSSPRNPCLLLGVGGLV